MLTGRWSAASVSHAKTGAAGAQWSPSTNGVSTGAVTPTATTPGVRTNMSWRMTWRYA